MPASHFGLSLVSCMYGYNRRQAQIQSFKSSVSSIWSTDSFLLFREDSVFWGKLSPKPLCVQGGFTAQLVSPMEVMRAGEPLSSTGHLGLWWGKWWAGKTGVQNWSWAFQNLHLQQMLSIVFCWLIISRMGIRNLLWPWVSFEDSAFLMSYSDHLERRHFLFIG